MWRHGDENDSRERDDQFVATTTAAIIAGLAAAGGSVAAAKIASSGAGHAADLQSKANADALAYTKDQDRLTRAQAEVDRKANYDQWRAKQQAVSAFGAQYGVPGMSIPDYVPGTLGEAAGASPTSAGPAAPSGAPEFIKQWQATHPVSEGMGPLTAALQAKGFDVKPYLYGQTPSHNEISLDGAKYKVISGEDGPNAAWYAAGSYDGGGARPYAPGTLGAATRAGDRRLVAPPPDPTRRPYAPGTLGSYV